MTTEQQPDTGTISRRSFIEGLGFATGGVLVGIAMGLGIPKLGDDDGDSSGAGSAPRASSGGQASDGGDASSVVPAIVTAHPRLKVGSLSSIAVGDVVDFEYPTEQSPASLFRIGRAVSGGIGPDSDIVAFGTDCTHMGCPLRGLYRPEHQILGPCGCHYTTFDLTLRGMVVLGQATENLPQILLDLDGDDIVAVGTIGILYGFRNNLADAPIVKGL